MRLSILGALPAETIENFRDAWAASTTTGLHSRMIICPGPATWKWDHRLEIHGEYRRPQQGICISDAAHQVYLDWRDAAPKRGRLAEIGQRVALLSASLNGEKLVNVECMTAAMHFAAWQEGIRDPYAASLAENPDAKVMDVILRAVNREGRYKAGEQKGQPMWVRWRDLYRRGSWHKYGSAVTRVRESLTRDGIIEAQMERQMDDYDKPIGPPKWTGHVRPIDD